MLTEAEIDAMEAGKPLDLLVAMEIFGYDPMRDTIDTRTGYAPDLPDFSYEWEDMGRVIEKIIEENWWVDVGGDFFLENWQDGEWVCCNRAPGDSRKTRLISVFYAVGRTPMEAVCRVALKAKLGLKVP